MMMVLSSTVCGYDVGRDAGTDTSACYADTNDEYDMVAYEVDGDGDVGVDDDRVDGVGGCEVVDNGDMYGDVVITSVAGSTGGNVNGTGDSDDGGGVGDDDDVNDSDVLTVIGDDDEVDIGGDGDVDGVGVGVERCGGNSEHTQEP